MVNTFTYNGVKSSVYGLFISGEATYGMPARNVTVVSIPGKNGDLTYDNGSWQNIQIDYPCYINDKADKQLPKIYAWLSVSKGTYLKLADTYHPDHYRLGYFANAISPEMHFFNGRAFLTISFICKPQRFLTSGDSWITVTNGGTITNPTAYESKPIIRVVGKGDLSISDKTFRITSAGTEYIDLDSELMDAYEGTTNRNSYTSGEYITLHAGTNGVKFDSTITSVKVMPRWFEL